MIYGRFRPPRRKRLSHATLAALLSSAGALLSAAGAQAAIIGSAPAILSHLAPAWIDDFSSRHPDRTVRLLKPFGPPQGRLDPHLARFLAGRSDFALISRALSEADRLAFRRTHGADPLVIPVAGGAWNRFGYVDPVVVIVNIANPIQTISLRQLDAIFSDSHWRGGAAAKDWGAAGVAPWAGRPIHVIGGDAWAAEESARAQTFRQVTLDAGGHRGRWRKVPGSGGESDAVARVAADRFAIAFTGFGHIGAGVKTLALRSNDRSPPIQPDRNMIATGRYPLARTVDLLLAPRPDGSIGSDQAALAAYLLSTAGQAVVVSTGPFLPLTAAQRATSLRLIRRGLPRP